MPDPHPAGDEDPEQHIGAPVDDPWNVPSGRTIRTGPETIKDSDQRKDAD